MSHPLRTFRAQRSKKDMRKGASTDWQPFEGLRYEEAVDIMKTTPRPISLMFRSSEEVQRRVAAAELFQRAHRRKSKQRGKRGAAAHTRLHRSANCSRSLLSLCGLLPCDGRTAPIPWYHWCFAACCDLDAGLFENPLSTKSGSSSPISVDVFATEVEVGGAGSPKFGVRAARIPARGDLRSVHHAGGASSHNCLCYCLPVGFYGSNRISGTADHQGAGVYTRQPQTRKDIRRKVSTAPSSVQPGSRASYRA